MKCYCLLCFLTGVGAAPTVPSQPCFLPAHGLPCGNVQGKSVDVPGRAAKLLTQEPAGSRQHSSAGCLHKGMPGTQLIGDHLAAVLGSLSRFSCLCKTLFGYSPFSIYLCRTSALVFQLLKAGPQAAPLVPLKLKEVIHTLVKLQQPGILHPCLAPSCPPVQQHQGMPGAPSPPSRAH